MAERPTRRRRSIRVRLVVRSLLAATVVLTAAGWAVTAAVDQQLRDQIDRRLVADIDGAIVVSDLLTPEQRAEMAERNRVSKYAILVVGPAGNLVVSAPPDAGDVAEALDGITVATLVERGGEPFTVPGDPDLRVAALPLSGEIHLAYAAPLGEVSSAITTARWTILVIGLGALAVLGLFVSLIGRSVVRPLEGMIDAADAIGEGALDRRVPDGQPDAESERLASALNAMLERLATSFRDQERSERELRDFVSDAAHELRTPLATVQASAEILEESRLDVDDVSAAAHRIRTQSRRMAHLVDDLVLLARLKEGAVELDRSAVDLRMLAAGAVDRAEARQPGWPTALDGGEPVVVLADPSRIEQAVDDLLDNVAVHTPRGTTAQVRVHRDGDAGVMEVRDDGPGLPDDELDRAWERLYRGSAARAGSRPGSGLGLAIVRGVAEAHGGSLELVPGTGFTAVLRLPLEQRGAPGEAVPPEPDETVRAERPRAAEVRANPR